MGIIAIPEIIKETATAKNTITNDQKDTNIENTPANKPIIIGTTINPPKIRSGICHAGVLDFDLILFFISFDRGIVEITFLTISSILPSAFTASFSVMNKNVQKAPVTSLLQVPFAK